MKLTVLPALLRPNPYYTPLVSVFSTVMNAEKTIKRCIDSILAQDYSNFEIVVQDGASTDGTLDILKSYGDRINLNSSSDSGFGEGFYKALQRCKGEIVIACLADEELLAGTLSWGVKYFHRHPSISIVYGDIYTTDIHGEIIGRLNSKKFNYKKCLCSEFAPFFSSTFFKKSCFDENDLSIVDTQSYIGYIDWCIWWVFGLKYKTMYVSEVLSKYALHQGQLTSQTEVYDKNLAVRLRVIDHLTKDISVKNSIKKLRSRAFAGCYLHNAQQFIRLGDYEKAKQMVVAAQKTNANSFEFLSLVQQINEIDGVSDELISGKESFLIKWAELLTTIKFYGVKKVIIFGAGIGALLATSVCKRRNIEIECLIDNSKKKQGTQFLGMQINSVDNIRKVLWENIDAVIITSKIARISMIKQIKELGFDCRIIYLNPGKIKITY